jgi:xylulokinase
MGVLLGIDIGTSSSKAVLVRPDGTVLAQARREHGVSSPHAGWFEHDADGIWWSDLVALCGELLPAGEELIALGVSGIGPCLLPADAAGRPLRPAILYGVDTRATRQIAEQTERYGAGAILGRCGSPLTSQAIGPKLAWLVQNEPEVWALTRRWFMAGSHLVFRLTGEYVLDHHSASQSVPLYDSLRHEWIADWCEQIAPGLEWPRLAWPGEVVGHVTAGASAVTGLPCGLPVIAGTVDAWSEAVSVAVTEPGDTMLMYGTTMFMVQVTARRSVHPRLWSTVGAFPGTYTLAAGMATSGAITSWLRDLTGSSYERLTEEARAVSPGSGGLLMLPYFAGERTPLFDPDARGVVAGLTLHHTRGHLYRSALEATALGVRHNLAAMRSAGAEPRRLVAVGGGTQGGLWCQIVSDVTGLPQVLPRQTVGAAFGDALLAGLATGVVDDPAVLNPAERTVEPDPVTGDLYDRLYADYLRLYEVSREVAHRLAAEQIW